MKAPQIAADGRLWWLAALVVLALLQGTAAGIAAFSTRELFASMHAAGMGSEPLRPGLLLSLAGAGFVVAVSRVAFRGIGERLGQDYVRDIRLALFDHASRMWPRDLAARRVGHVNLRFVGDLSALKNWPARGIPKLVEGALFLPIMLAVLFVLARDFGWIGTCVVTLSLATLALAAQDLAEAHRKVRSLRGKLAADLAERMPLASDLAAIGRRQTESDIIHERSVKLSKAAVALVTRAEFLRGLPDALVGMAAAIMIWRGVLGALPTGTIAAGLAAFALMAKPLREFMGIANTFAAYQAARRKLDIALAKPVAPSRSKSGVKLASGPIDLHLKSLKLADVSPLDCRFAAGEKGIIKVNGNAESLVRAILGKEPILAGDVFFSGTSISKLTPGSLRRGVSVITDSPVILQGSLRRAITFGLAERPTDEAMCKTLEKRNLLSFLKDIGGFDRHLQEGARLLSREDRIKISVLRTALAASGLILVEPDAALADPDFESWLNKDPATVARILVFPADQGGLNTQH
jgi:ATP-binding cassette, subfamily B, bacterial